MRMNVICPKCGCDCKCVLEKTLSINKDLLFICPSCNIVIPVRLFYVKDKINYGSN